MYTYANAFQISVRDESDEQNRQKEQPANRQMGNKRV